MIIVRESDVFVGCICCSGGMSAFGAKDRSYESIRKTAEECGRLHREIRERYGEDEVEIIQIEPKAYFFLMPRVLADVLRYNPSFSPAIRTILFLYAVPLVIANGKPVGVGRVPSIEEISNELGRH